MKTYRKPIENLRKPMKTYIKPIENLGKPIENL